MSTKVIVLVDCIRVAFHESQPWIAMLQVTAAAGWSRSSENEWVRHLHSITLLHGALEQCEQVDVSSADAYFRHVDHLGFREGSCKGAGFAVALSDPEQVEEDVVIGEYGKAVPLDGASRILRGTKIRWALAR